MKDIILENAHRYIDIGISVIPTWRESKKPCLESWTEYQKRLPTHQELEIWWEKYPEANVAIVTGKISGIVVVDIDGADVELAIPPSCALAKTNRGKHVYFRYPKGIDVKNRVGIIEKVDIRSEGGYVIAPPSKHAGGTTYEWFSCLSLEEIGLDNLCEYKEHELFPSLPVSTFQKNSFVIPEEFLLVKEGNRNDSLARFAGRVYRHTEEQLWPISQFLLKTWNLHCVQPPLSDLEVLATLQSIEGMERRRRAEGGQNIEELGSPTSWNELKNKEILGATWAVNQLFEAGTINMISAPPNHYKSWLLLHIAACIASGSDVFGRFATSKKGVLIVNEEDGERTLQDRIRKIAEEDNLNVFFYSQKGIKLNKEMVDALLGQARLKGAEVIMFDSFRTIHESDENNSQEIQKVIDLLKLMTKQGFTLVMTHHHRKGLSGQPKGRGQTADDARGSSAISAALHGHISCEERIIEGKKVILISQQKLKASAKINNFYVQCPNEGQNELYKFLYQGEEKSRKEASEKMQVQILSIFEENPGRWFSVQEIEGLFEGIPGTTIRNILKALVEKENLLKAERGTHPYLYVDGIKHNASFYSLRPEL